MTFRSASMRAKRLAEGCCSGRTAVVRSRSRVPRRAPRRDEAGAILVLALIFMVASSLVVTGLAAWSGNDIMNIGTLKNARITVYSADYAIQDTISNIRYSYPASPSGGFGSNCTPVVQPSQPQAFKLDDPNDPNPQIAVTCGTFSFSDNDQSRTVTLSAYPYSDFCAAGNTWQLCSATDKPFVQATVVFDDVNTFNNGSSTANDCKSTASPQTTCGLGLTIQSWVVQPGLT